MTPKKFTFVAVILAAFILLDIFMADGAALRTNRDGEPDSKKRPKPSGCPVPLIYRPVCGSDGKVYVNKYSLKCAQKDNPDLHEVDRSKCPSFKSRHSKKKAVL